MHTFSKDLHWRLGAFLASVLLLVLMQGCVNVNVSTTCPPRGGGGSSEIVDGPGGCNKMGPIVNPWTTDANTFFKIDLSAVPTGQTPPYRCTAGYRCAGLPGSCLTNGPKCKTWWLSPVTAGSRDGNCSCDCANAYP